MVKLEFDEAKPDIFIVGESNMSSKEPGVKDDFQGYTIENKFFNNCERSRISVFINDNHSLYKTA